MQEHVTQKRRWIKNMLLDIMTVYNAARKNYPRFSINDTNSFLQLCIQISDSYQSLCKIFFKTKLMQAHNAIMRPKR